MKTNVTSQNNSKYNSRPTSADGGRCAGGAGSQAVANLADHRVPKPWGHCGRARLSRRLPHPHHLERSRSHPRSRVPSLFGKGRPKKRLGLRGGLHISPAPPLSGLVTFPWAVDLESMAMQSARSGCAKAASAPAILENGQRTRPRTRSARGKGIPSIKDQARETSQMPVFC